MIVATLYFSSSDETGNEVEEILEDLQTEVPHKLIKVDIDTDPALQKVYQEHVPVVEVGPYILRSPYITRKDILVALGSARDRVNALEKVGDQKYQQRVKRGRQFSKTDQFSLWFSRRYMLIFNLVVFLYVGLPFLAPVLMEANAVTPARIIYKIYSPFCHQLPFRSWFLFGEQPVYPRELAHLDHYHTYEELIGTDDISVLEARDFVGNETAGYKVAFCQRDIAIYGGILLFGLLFSITGRRLKTIPWYIWVAVGLVPIGVDGVSQLPGLMQSIVPDWVPLRESTPFLRTLTGSLFGITTAWYLYPMIEETLNETRRVLLRKKAVSEQIAK